MPNLTLALSDTTYRRLKLWVASKNTSLSKHVEELIEGDMEEHTELIDAVIRINGEERKYDANL
jgi:hypothetical protein